MPSISPEEILPAIRASVHVNSHQASELYNYLEGVADAYYAIATYGVCNWSKGIDSYSEGMNSVSSWYNGRIPKEMQRTQDEAPLVDTELVIDTFQTIRAVAKNMIKQNGMRTIDELASFGIKNLGGTPNEDSN